MTILTETSGTILSSNPIRSRAWILRVLIVATVSGIVGCFVDPYLAYLATSWMIFGLLGFSLDLVWGRAGILSLGQTAFYGIGGYLGSTAAINLSSLTGNTIVWSVPCGAIAGLCSAALIGWFIFYGRLGPLQATILTYTFTLLLWTGSVSFNARIGDAAIGGDNGLANVPGYVVAFGKNAEALGPNGTLICAILIAASVFILVGALMRSPFGLVIDCIRLNADKTEMLGYDVRRYQLYVFVLAGGIAGIAGALYGSWANYLTPSVFSVQEALIVPIYVLVGGRGTLAGPFIGALLVGGLSFWLGGGVIGGQTTLVMGLCLIVLVLYLDGGLLGSVVRLMTAKSRRAPYAKVGDEGKSRGPELDTAFLDRMCSDSSSVMNGRLETNAIVKRFGGVTPVKCVTLKFEPGKVHCLIGPNGAGKSTFLRCCIGVHLIDGGDILISGARVNTVKIFERVKAGLGIKMQAPQVFDELDVRQNLWVAAYSRTHDQSAAQRDAEQILRVLGMTARANHPANGLSHGEQQWLDIGMVLCLAPSIILLDEPAAGMTGEERRMLSKLVRVLAKSATVIVVEHDMEFVRSLDAEVFVLHQGELFAHGSIDDLRQDERVLDIYLGRRRHVRNL